MASLGSKNRSNLDFYYRMPTENLDLSMPTAVFRGFLSGFLKFTCLPLPIKFEALKLTGFGSLEIYFNQVFSLFSFFKKFFPVFF